MAIHQLIRTCYVWYYKKRQRDNERFASFSRFFFSPASVRMGKQDAKGSKRPPIPLPPPLTTFNMLSV